MTPQTQTFCPSCGTHNALQELPGQKVKACRVCKKYHLICPHCSWATVIGPSLIPVETICNTCDHQFNYQQAL